MIFDLFLLFLFKINVASVTWITTTEHDFGTVRTRTEACCEFRFRNTSAAAIAIDNVRTSCGCAAPDWSATPVPPDSTGVIKIAYFSRSTGRFEKKIKVWLHGIRRPETLTIRGNVSDE